MNWRTRPSLDWKQRQALRYFPYSRDYIYNTLFAAGFDPTVYRSSWPDLVAALVDDSWSAPHFLEFMDAESIVPRVFPINLSQNGLLKIANLIWISKRKRATILRSLFQTAIDYRQQLASDAKFWHLLFECLDGLADFIIIFGDSHSRIFRQTVDNRHGPAIVINVLCGGGSAGGLGNTDSLSGYGRMIEQSCIALQEALGRRKCPIGFKFGQVDLEFVITYRRSREDRRLYDRQYAMDFSSEVARKYVDWIAALPRLGKVVMGVNPPCLTNDFILETYTIQAQTYINGRVADTCFEQQEQIISNFSNLEFPSLRERTEIHRYFNEAVSKRARDLGVSYIDNFDDFLDADGCLQPRFAQSVFAGSMKVGVVGKDIHLGGPDTVIQDARLLGNILSLS